MPVEKLLVSITEAAEMIGVTRSTVYQLLISGQMRDVRIGRRRLIPITEVQGWAARIASEQTEGR